jgi:hypothetical protein
MMKKLIYYILLVFITLCSSGYAQYYYGDGSDGDLTISSANTFYSDQTRAQAESYTGQNVTLSSTYSYSGGTFGSFQTGDRVIIIQMEGDDVGHYDIAELTNVSGNTLTFPGSSPNVDLSSYDWDGVIQVVYVPRWDDLSLSGTITCNGYDGHTGGIIMFCVDGEFRVNSSGVVDASGKGYPSAVELLDDDEYGTGGSGGAQVPGGSGGVPGDNPGDNGGNGDGTVISYGLSGYDLCENGSLNYTAFAGGGGDGGNGTLPSDPNNGTDGLDATAFPDHDPLSLLTMGNCGAGGNGGISGEAGGNGGAGGNGLYDGTAGEDGGDGEPGGDGGDGGNGGGSIYIRARLIAVAAGTHFISEGEDAEDGEDGEGNLTGGVGGAGGAGGNGGLSGSVVYGPGGGGAPGGSGDGSGGGDGGDGGDAGYIWIEYYQNYNNSLSSGKVEIKGGNGGSGGSGAYPYPVGISYGTSGTLDLSATGAIPEPCSDGISYCEILPEFLHYCTCSEAFCILAEMDNANWDADHWDFTSQSDPDKDCIYNPTDPDGKLLACSTRTTLTGSCTGPGGTQTDIYTCYLDNDPGETYCDDHFDDIGNALSQAGNCYGSYSLFLQSPNQKKYTNSSAFLDDDGSTDEPCNCDCNNPSNCLNSHCPYKGPDGEDGDNGEGSVNDNFYMGSHCPIIGTGLNEDSPSNIDFDGLLITVQPNPANDYIEINYIADKNFRIELSVIDLHGKVIYEKDLSVETGEASIRINIRSWPSGTYLLNVESNAINKFLKFNKL